MRDVARHRQDILLNEKAISNYLSEVAPVPFSSQFSFSTQIETHLRKNGAWIDPIEITVCRQPLRRPFTNRLVPPGGGHPIELGSVELLELSDVDGSVGAAGWIAHHQYSSSISSTLGVRGLRVRCGNVQIGDEHLFDEVFPEVRFNGWTIAEVHVVDRRLKPNARRDNFELNHHYYNLSAQLSALAKRIANLCRTSSIERNAKTDVSSKLAEVKDLLSSNDIIQSDVSRSKAKLFRAEQRLRMVKDFRGSSRTLSKDKRSSRTTQLPLCECRGADSTIG